ncbi:MAG: glycosyltransferase, partial [Pseudomonadota bacterium]
MPDRFDGELPKVLVIHNRYQQAGGEDAVFANEVALLRSSGSETETLTADNDDIQGALAKAAAALRVIHNPAGRAAVAEAIARFRPDVVHVHNFFPKLSPAVFDACADSGVPVVWTLHNFRLACANGLLFRDGRPCEDCVGRAPISAVLHRCYRGSLAGSAAVAGMIGFHNMRGTWQRKVTRFIVLSDFARALVTRAGVPAERISVKPNFIFDPLSGIDPGPPQRGGAVFVGRLSAEKGATVMIEAWRKLPNIPLTLLGDGPERAALEAAAPANVRFLGFQQRAEVMAAVQSAQAIVVPSTCYENFPLAVVEAMALGTPVIA